MFVDKDGALRGLVAVKGVFFCMMWLKTR